MSCAASRLPLCQHRLHNNDCLFVRHTVEQTNYNWKLKINKENCSSVSVVTHSHVGVCLCCNEYTTYTYSAYKYITQYTGHWCTMYVDQLSIFKVNKPKLSFDIFERQTAKYRYLISAEARTTREHIHLVLCKQQECTRRIVTIDSEWNKILTHVRRRQISRRTCEEVAQLEEDSPFQRNCGAK